MGSMKFAGVLLQLSFMISFGRSLVINHAHDVCHENFYQGTVHSMLWDKEEIITNVKFTISSIHVHGADYKGFRFEQLHISSMDQLIPMKSNERHDFPEVLLKSRFIMQRDENGLVRRVYYDYKDEADIVSIKKYLASSLSNHISLQQKENEYQVYEQSHAGFDHHHYKVKEYGKSKVYHRRKVHKSKDPTHYEKIIHVKDNIVHSLTSNEKLNIPGQEQNEPRRENGTDFHMAVNITLQATRSCKMQSLSINVLNAMKNDTLDASLKYQKVNLTYVEAERKLLAGLECLKSHHYAKKEFAKCATDMMQVLRGMKSGDLYNIGKLFLYQNCSKGDDSCQMVRNFKIDLIATVDTTTAQQLMLKYIFRQHQNEEEINRCLLHFSSMKNPSKDVVQVLENLCFGHERKHHGTFSMEPLQRRACTSLGGVLQHYVTQDEDKATEIIELMHDWLHMGREIEVTFHEEHSYRDIVQNIERRKYIQTKGILLHALGNAGHKLSTKSIVTLLIDESAHVDLRHTAAKALRKYDCKESATALLNASLHDQELSVRSAAYSIYKDHPHAYQLTAQQEDIILSKTKNSVKTLKRSRRFLCNLIEKLTFEKTIELPGLDWQKTVGGSPVGADFGVSMRNRAKMHISPVAMFFEVDVDNKAWLSAIYNVFNIFKGKFDIFRGEVCFKRDFRLYNLSKMVDLDVGKILGEMGNFEQIKESVISPIIKAVNSFNSFIGTWKDEDGNFDFGAGASNLLQKLLNPDENDLEGISEILSSLGVDSSALNEVTSTISTTINHIQTVIEEKLTNIKEGITSALGNIPINMELLENLISDINIMDLFKNPRKIIDNIIKSLKESPVGSVMVWSSGLMGKMNDLIPLLQKLPYLMENIRNLITKFTEILRNFHSSELKDILSSLLQTVHMFIEEKAADILSFFEDIVDEVTMTSQYIAGAVQDPMKFIEKATKAAEMAPTQASKDIEKGVQKVKESFTLFQTMKGDVEEFQGSLKGKLPSWLESGQDFNFIDHMFSKSLNKLNVLGQKIILTEQKQKSNIDSTLKIQNTLKIMTQGEDIISQLKKEFSNIKFSGDHFREAFEQAKNAMTKGVTVFSDLKHKAEDGKEEVQKVFGLKFHPNFPQQTRENCDERCGGCGIYPNVMYGRKGLQLLVPVGKPIVSPLDGIVHKHQRESHVIIIEPISEDMKDNAVHLSHVDILPELVDEDGTVVDAGDIIGSAVKSPCQPNFIHMAVAKKFAQENNKTKSTCENPNGIADFLNIGKFFKMPEAKPLFKEACQKMEFKHIFNYIDFDNLADKFTEILADPGIILDAIKDKIQDFIKQLPEFPVSMEKFEDWEKLLKGVNEVATKFGKKFSKVVSGAKKVIKVIRDKSGKKIHIPDFLPKPLPRVTDYISTTKFTVKGFMNFLQSFGLYKEARALQEIALKLCDVHNGGAVGDLSEVIPYQLRENLLKYGVKLDGSLDVLKHKAEHAFFKGCGSLEEGIANGMKTICTVGKLCSEISCQIKPLLGYLDQTVSLYAAFDPCTSQFDMRILQWKYNINLSSVGDLTIHKTHTIDFGSDMYLKASVKLEKNSKILKLYAQLKVCMKRFAQCWDTLQVFNGLKFNMDVDCTLWKSSGNEDEHMCDDIMNMKIPDFILALDRYQLPELKLALNITEIVRLASLKSLLDGIKIKSSVDGNEVRQMPDSKSNDDLKKGPFIIPFFEMRYQFYFFFLKFGAGGTVSFNTVVDVQIINGTTSMSLEPTIGAAAWLEGGIDIFIAKGGLKLTGYLLETSFNFTIEMNYARYPIETKKTLRIDLMPVGIKVEAYFKLLWKKWKTVLFEWRADRIIGKPNVEKEFKHDETPPEFEWPSKKCKVEQITERDLSDPAVLLEAPFSDPDSPVTMEFAVGTYKGGTNIEQWTKFQAVSQTIHLKPTLTGQPLHWTVRAFNEERLESSVFCLLDTYDITPPTGRFVPQYIYSSHPFHLSATLSVVEESKLALTQEFNIGLGKGEFGEQIVEWAKFDMVANKGTQSSSILERFTNPQLGKLIKDPIATHKTKDIRDCAYKCEMYGNGCSSFSIDLHTSTCELNHYIIGIHAKLAVFGGFHYYEKLNTGYGALFSYSNLMLKHGIRYYFNGKITNELGFVSYISSAPIVVDFTPPGPGVIKFPERDSFTYEECTAIVHESGRCTSAIKLPNHRVIIDGNGSATVFNGHFPGQEFPYTYVHTFITANWKGFIDNETDIWGYYWAVGREICGADIVPYIFVKHPTSNVYAEKLNLQPGKYYITVRAVNNVQYGGPMATTICHTLPTVIDTSPPLMHFVEDVFHDEDFDLLAIYYKGSDPDSGILRTDIGLGETRHDAFIRSYTKHDPLKDGYEMVLLDGVDLPEGIPIWIRVRVVNYVEMHTAGHGKQPIMLDKSAPSIGNVFDGDSIPFDLQYQPYNDHLCVQWYNWYDSESGIDRYTWAIGSKVDKDDIQTFKEYPHHKHYACSVVELSHGKTYFSTIKAYNRGVNSRSSNATSNGITVDLTDPEAGVVIDGLDVHYDMNFSSHAASCYSNWNHFRDPESGIKEYNINVFVNSQIEKSTIVSNEVHKYNDHSFHFKHNDFVQTEIVAENGATRKVKKQSTGFIIDLTPPELDFAKDSENGLPYQVNLTAMHLRWKYNDVESSIMEYKLQIMEHAGGQMLRIFPKLTMYEIYKPKDQNEEINIVLKNMQFRNGHKYSANIIATNYAGLSHKHSTSGFLVDITPPILSKIFIGMFGSEEQLNEKNEVIHADHNGIHVSWVAFDHESGIQRYEFAVGSGPEKSDITIGFRNHGSETSAYITGINITVTDVSGILYYVTVVAVNGAGKYSNILSSKPIHVYDINSPGVVFDGQEKYVNNDFSSDSKIIGISFSGFKSPACGIDSYEWALGSAPGESDIMPFSSNGIVMENKTHGFACANINSYHGQIVFAFVRAVTGYKCHEDLIESTSDGITVDKQAPGVSLINLKRLTSIQKDYEQVVYTNETSELRYEFKIKDENVGLRNIEIYFGHEPFNSVDENYLHKVKDNILTISRIPHHNSTETVTVLSSDKLDNTNVFTTPSITIDHTPPAIKKFHCLNYASVQNRRIVCKWTQVEDYESYVLQQKICVGFNQFGEDISECEIVPLINNEWKKVFDIVVLERSQYSSFVVTLSIENAVGLKFHSFQKIIIDNSPPEVGNIYITTPTHPNEAAVHKICQQSQSTIQLEWDGFLDNQSGIKSFIIYLGTLPGGRDVLKEIEVKHKKKLLINNLPLRLGKTYYVSIQSVNYAGLNSIVITQPITVSPSFDVKVQDGLLDKDISYQSDLSLISGHVTNTQNCPFVSGFWWIYDVDGTVIQNETEFKGSKFQNDELDLKNEKTYYIKVKVKDSLNRTVLRKSNGVTTILEKPHPGVVRDGSLSTDLDFQYSAEYLITSWDGLSSLGNELKITNYEVSIGTKPSKGEGATDIHYFVNVGLNQSYTFHNLHLVSKSIKYYVCVRAHSANGAYIDSFSDGIRVGYSDIMQPGIVDISKYISSTTLVSVSWDGFKSDFEIKNYMASILSFSFNETNTTLPCEKLLPTFAYLQIHNAGKNTYTEVTTTKLSPGIAYYVLIIAEDMAGRCVASSSDAFYVDISPPSEGYIHIEGLSDDVQFTTSTDKLHVRWEGFADVDSPILHYKIQLLSSPLNCKNQYSFWVPVTETIDVSQVESHTFYGIDLSPINAYKITLEVMNMAGLKTVKDSTYILVDITSPNVGTVRVGQDWKMDAKYIEKNSDINTTIAISYKKYDCRKSVQIKPNQWDALDKVNIYSDQSHLWNKKVIEYNERNFNFDAANKMELTYHINISKGHLEGAAIQTNITELAAGNYTLNILPMMEQNYVLSVSFSTNGYFQEYVNFELPFSEEYDDDDDFFNNAQAVDINWEDNNYFNVTTTSAPSMENNFNISMKMKSQDNLAPGFGYHILCFPIGAANNYKIGFWVRSSKGIEIMWTQVEKSFFYKWNQISMEIAHDSSTSDPNIWNVRFIVNNEVKSSLSGIEINKNITFNIRQWSYENIVPVLKDPFNPLFVNSRVSNLEIPVQKKKFCHYGNAFFDDESGLYDIYLGIGNSSDGVANVVPLTKVSEICQPCDSDCPKVGCNPTCSNNVLQDFQLLYLSMTNLSLIPGSYEIGNGNVTIFIPQIYHMVVEVLNGAGLANMALSSGFMIDSTPPTVRILYATDPTFDPNVPVDRQCSRESMGAVFEFEEPESTIETYFVAFGSCYLCTDIIPFYNVGQQTSILVDTSKYSLSEGSKYFITIKGINAAGLATIISTDGVTIDCSPPNVTDVSPQPMFISNSNYEEADFTDSNKAFGLNIDTEINKDIWALAWGIGTDRNNNYIMESQLLDANLCHQLELRNGSIWQNNERTDKTLTGISQSLQQQNLTEEQIYEDIILEPGRCLYHHLFAVTLANVKAQIAIKPLCVSGTGNVVMNISSESFSQSFTTEQNLQIDIYGTGRKGSMLFGMLEEKDWTTVYKSAANLTYSPYVVDPNKTYSKTSRTLKNRLQQFKGIAWFLSPIQEVEIDGPIVVMSNKIDISNHSAWLFWNNENQYWMHISEICKDHLPKENSTGRTVDMYCGSDSTRRIKRKESNIDHFHMRQPVMFALFSILPSFLNTPPTLVENNYKVNCNDKLEERLLIEDKEGDFVEVFLLQEPKNGTIELSVIGNFVYMPDNNFFGVDTFVITIVETYLIKENLPPLEQRETITIDVLEVPLPPVLLFEPNIAAFDGDRDNLSQPILTPFNGDIILNFEGNNSVKHLGFFIICDPNNIDNVEILMQFSDHTGEVNHTFLAADDKYFNQSLNDCKMSGTNKKIFSASVETEREFHGNISAKIISKDRYPLFSQHIGLQMKIFVNPCIYGHCTSESNTGLSCLASERTVSFDRYKCSCNMGYDGYWCNVEIDECLINPCGNLYSCTDFVAYRECVIKPISLAFLVAGLLVLLLLLLVGIMYLKKRLPTGKNKIHPEGSPSQEEKVEMNLFNRFPKQSNKVSPIDNEMVRIMANGCKPVDHSQDARTTKNLLPCTTVYEHPEKITISKFLELRAKVPPKFVLCEEQQRHKDKFQMIQQRVNVDPKGSLKEVDMEKDIATKQRKVGMRKKLDQKNKKSW